MGWIERRRGILNKIQFTIDKAWKKGLTTSKKKLIAVLSLDDGVSERKAEEYLRSLQNNDRICIIGDNITPKNNPKLEDFNVNLDKANGGEKP